MVWVGCFALPALCDARAGASFGGGGLLARGFRRERSGRDGLAAGWMSGAELAGGFAVVADSQVRVFEHRDTMLVGWGASGRGLAHGTRDGRRAETWRRPCVARAPGRDAERWWDGSTRALRQGVSVERQLLRGALLLALLRSARLAELESEAREAKRGA